MIPVLAILTFRITAQERHDSSPTAIGLRSYCRCRASMLGCLTRLCVGALCTWAPSSFLEPWDHAQQRYHDGVGMSVRTRLTNASSSSRPWTCVVCPKTTGSTRPSQPRAAPEGWVRHCTRTPDESRALVEAGSQATSCTAPWRRGRGTLSIGCQEDTRRCPFKTMAQAFKWRGEAPLKCLNTV